MAKKPSNFQNIEQNIDKTKAKEISHFKLKS